MGRNFPAVVHNNSTLVCYIDSVVSILHTSQLLYSWSNCTIMNFPIESNSGTDQRGLLCESIYALNVCSLFVVYMYIFSMCHLLSSHVLLSSFHSLPCLSIRTVALYSCPEHDLILSSCIGLNETFSCMYLTNYFAIADGSCMVSTLICSLDLHFYFEICPIPMFDEVCTNEHDCVNASIVRLYSVYYFILIHFRLLQQLVLLKEVLYTLSGVVILIHILKRMRLF